ncbi:conserved hypothetical protein [Bacillus altitudinis]|uniref:Uncharacterized protein n=1 Tax=Bacillus altitudinis TaxID=293387 RepID=A0A653MJF3_BACAB|nr:hypothetical protein US8_03947 [Bacillus altitudinis]VXB05270.1 conserved hypothetical protein [Bacillus altitudinis]
MQKPPHGRGGFFVDGYDRVLSQIQTTAVYQFIGSFFIMKHKL